MSHVLIPQGCKQNNVGNPKEQMTWFLKQTNKYINDEELIQILKDWREKWTKCNAGLCFLTQTNQP